MFQRGVLVRVSDECDLAVLMRAIEALVD